MGKRRARRPARAAYAPRLIVMAKSPRAGRAKRRLAASVGAISATRFYRTCLSHTLMRLGARSALANPACGVSGQRGERAVLAARNRAACRKAEAISGRGCSACSARLPPGPAIIVGSDIPAIKASDIARAFRLLGNARRGVRACDRRRLLARRLAPQPRACSRRSPACAGLGRMPLPTRLRNLKGSRVAFAATLSDVDTEEDYRRLRRNWQRLIEPAP